MNRKEMIKYRREEKKYGNAKNEIESINQFKRPILEEDKSGFGDKTLACPNCHKPIINVWSQKEYKPNYCHYCGQGFRWEERE